MDLKMTEKYFYGCDNIFILYFSSLPPPPLLPAPFPLHLLIFLPTFIFVCCFQVLTNDKYSQLHGTVECSKT